MILDKIRNIYLFDWFSTAFLDNILTNAKIINFKKWETIIKQWEKSQNAYIIISWIVWVFKDNKNINTIFEWDIFWEIWLVTNEPRTATIVAETNIEVLEISKETLMKIMKNLPNWEVIQKTILNRIIQNNQK